MVAVCADLSPSVVSVCLSCRCFRPTENDAAVPGNKSREQDEKDDVRGDGPYNPKGRSRCSNYRCKQ